MIELSDEQQRSLHISFISKQCLTFSGIKEKCEAFKYSDGGIELRIMNRTNHETSAYWLNEEQTELLKLFLNEKL